MLSTIVESLELSELRMGAKMIPNYILQQSANADKIGRLASRLIKTIGRKINVPIAKMSKVKSDALSHKWQIAKYAKQYAKLLKKWSKEKEKELNGKPNSTKYIENELSKFTPGLKRKISGLSKGIGQA